MIDKINRVIEVFQEFFDTNFTRCDQESMALRSNASWSSEEN